MIEIIFFLNLSMLLQSCTRCILISGYAISRKLTLAYGPKISIKACPICNKKHIWKTKEAQLLVINSEAIACITITRAVFPIPQC